MKGQIDEAGFIRYILAVSSLLCIQIAKDENKTRPEGIHSGLVFVVCEPQITG
jgi:hypothetical protein